MSIPLPLIIALVFAPLALIACGDRLAKGSLRVFAIVAVVTWVLSTVVLTRLLQNTDDLEQSLFYLFIVLPAFGTLVAAVLATRLLRGPIGPALIFALQGWLVGLVVLLIGSPNHAHDGGLWDWGWAVVNALPAAYAACGAVAAASLRWRNAP